MAFVSEPPVPSEPVDSTTAITTQNSFTFTLSAGTFSFARGAINTYAVFLISDSGKWKPINVYLNFDL